MPVASWFRTTPERSFVLRRCAAAAAIFAGGAWIIKAGLALATGNEPAAAFAIGLGLFPFALLGLWSLVRAVPGRSAQLGGTLAAAAASSVVLATLVRAVGGADVEPSEDEITALTPFIALAGFGTFAALLVLGIAVRRVGALPGRYASLPWAMGLAAIPLLIFGGALETLNERLLELPVALLGLGWVMLGVALWDAATNERAAFASGVSECAGSRANRRSDR